MKRFIKRILASTGHRLVKIPPPDDRRVLDTAARGKHIVQRLSPDLRVLNGPFAGMKYPTLAITESALTPKILGSYESQLHDAIEQIVNTGYAVVIDMGSAEGYYAVGLAIRMPATDVHAFDINEHDVGFCKQMAQLNDVHNLSPGDWCSEQTLLEFDFKRKGLVFCDCEGYELQLFTKNHLVLALVGKNVDVLVELHDVITPGITSSLPLRFKETHDITIFSTAQKKLSEWSDLELLTPSERDFAVLEHRGGIDQSIYMEWAFFRARRQLH